MVNVREKLLFQPAIENEIIKVMIGDSPFCMAAMDKQILLGI